MLQRIRSALIGLPRNLRDPHVHHQLALVAFFAWVGLGSDGLSSSSYGPEEAFLALGAHPHLALFLAIAIVGTVMLISASYSQIIELFPSGGGGYLVASKLLGPTAGVVSGSALVVDYMLTVATSVASGCDAIFSFLPPGWTGYKVTAELAVIAGLVTLNLRGVRESVKALIPIFVTFVVTHVLLIVWGIVSRASDFGHVGMDTVTDLRSAETGLGAIGTIVLLLRAFSLGGGTFTGIEAVSNGMPILREPRVETARHTMLLMSISLSFTAGGILVCYLLHQVHHQPGLTLNATLWATLTRGWHIGGLPLGPGIVAVTLLSEGMLLFLAAQTGFIDGPRTLSAMAVDRWVPKRFAHLSERLVTQNGVLLMGVATAITLLGTGGRVSVLIVMYSINVFITFTLSQLGMTIHWWQVRRAEGHWRRRLGLALLGTVVCALILVVTSAVKFREGGWVTLVVTGALVGLCLAVRGHYDHVRRALRSLDESLADIPLPQPAQAPELSVPGPTAIVLVEGYDGLGLHTVLSIQRLFPRMFRNMVFCSAGLVDSGQFKGADSLEALEAKMQGDMEKFVDMAQRMGYYAEYRVAVGTDPVEELEGLCRDLTREFRGCTVFTGQLVFQRENLFTRALHQETSFAIQRRLQFLGIQVVILPIRVWEKQHIA
jgi:amino acid transporter